MGKLKNIAFGFVVLFIWVNLIYHRFLPFLSDHQQFREFLFSCVLAPCWESFCFIYAPYKILSAINKDLIIPGMTLACIIFGLMHGYGMVSLMMQGIMGGVFVWVYVRNGLSLTSAILLHAGWNFYVFLTS